MRQSLGLAIDDPLRVTLLIAAIEREPLTVGAELHRALRIADAAEPLTGCAVQHDTLVGPAICCRAHLDEREPLA